MADLTDSSWAILTAAGELPGGERMLQSLTYLFDRRQGRRSAFESHFQGPFSLEVAEAISRWIEGGLLRKTLTFDGSPDDPVEGAKVTLRPLVGPRGYERAASVSEVNAAQDLLNHAIACNALSPVATTVAAKLAWIRELDVPASRESLESLAAALGWARLTDAQRTSGVAFARALGY